MVYVSSAQNVALRPTALALLGFVLKLIYLGYIQTHKIRIHQGWDQASVF